MFPMNGARPQFLRQWYLAGMVVETVGWTRFTAILQTDIAPGAPQTQLIPVTVNGVKMTLPLSQLDI
jgi:hypothetical protein